MKTLLSIFRPATVLTSASALLLLTGCDSRSVEPEFPEPDIPELTLPSDPAASEGDSIVVSLPKRIYAVAGDELQLFFRGIVGAVLRLSPDR